MQDRLRAMRIVLVHPSHGGNVGSAARAIRAMGLDDLHLVDTPPAADAGGRPRWDVDPQAISLASGATDVLDRLQVTRTLEAAVADCEHVIGVSAASREFGPLPATPEACVDEALDLLDAARARRIAFVFGTERSGLTIEQVALCQRLCSIPADPHASSLNLAQAVQVVAYVIRQRCLMRAPPSAPQPWHHPERALATHAAIEGLHAHAARSLAAIGFLDERHPKKLAARLRRLFARTGLERAEIDLLRGICTRIDRMARIASQQGAASERPRD